MSLKRQKTVLERNKFYQTTSLAGFGLISASNTRVEAIVWYLVIGTFLIITVVNVSTITTAHLEYPTKTTVSVVHLNESYRPKYMGIAIQLGVPGYNPEYRKFQEKQFYFENGTQIPVVTNRTLAEEVQEAMKAFNTAEKIRTHLWPYGLLPMFTIFTHHLSKCEDGEDRKSQHLSDLINQTNKFIRHAANLGINQHEVIQIFGRQILIRCKIWHISGSEASRHLSAHWWLKNVWIESEWDFGSEFDSALFQYELSETNGLDIYRYAYLGYSNMEFSLYINDFISQYMDAIDTDNIGEGAEWYNAVYEPYLQVYIGDDYDEKASLKLYPAKSYYLEVAVSMGAVYKFFQKYTGGEPSCTNRKQSFYDCYKTVVNNEVREKCGCVLTLTRKSLGNIEEFCSLEQLQQCQHEIRASVGIHHTGSKAYNETPHYRCSLPLLQQCETEFLNVIIKETRGYSSSKSYMATNHGKIRFFIHYNQYPIFVEELEQTFTDYLADLGGSLDLWIGASIIGIIHLIVYVIKQIVYAFKRDTKTGKHIRGAFDNWRDQEQVIPQMMTRLAMALTKEEENTGINNERSSRFNRFEETVVWDSVVESMKEQIGGLQENHGKMQEQLGNIQENHATLQEQLGGIQKQLSILTQIIDQKL